MTKQKLFNIVFAVASVALMASCGSSKNNNETRQDPQSREDSLAQLDGRWIGQGFRCGSSVIQVERDEEQVELSNDFLARISTVEQDNSHICKLAQVYSRTLMQFETSRDKPYWESSLLKPSAQRKVCFHRDIGAGSTDEDPYLDQSDAFTGDAVQVVVELKAQDHLTVTALEGSPWCPDGGEFTGEFSKQE